MKADDRKQKSNWFRISGWQLCFHFWGAVLLHAYDCNFGTTDQCLMSKGFFVLYWGGFMFFLWPIVAITGAVRNSKAATTSSVEAAEKPLSIKIHPQAT